MPQTSEHETTRDSGASDIDEVGELVTTLFATSPYRLTACRGWTTHELVAHLAAGAAEEAELIERHLAGAPERPTREHEDRELPYRARPDAELRDQLVIDAARLGAALDQLAAGGDGAVLFTGRPMTAADFTMHSRSECTLHRWDLVGRDDVGWAMLGQAALTKHALTVLTSMATLPEAPANRLRGSGAVPGDLRLTLRSAPHDDVVVRVSTRGAEMTLETIGDDAPDIEMEPAARLLLLWGRREPSAPMMLHASADRRRMLESLFAL